MMRTSWGPVIGLLAALLVFVLLFLLAPAPQPQPAPTVTVDDRPQTATPTRTEDGEQRTVVPTATAMPTATAISTADHRSPTASSTPVRTETPTPPPTSIPEPQCRAGVITAHAAMAAVLANKPERACAGCTYFASVLCQDLGQAYDLHVSGMVIPVRVADCATWSVGDWPQKNGRPWLGELDINNWPTQVPLAPMEALLCTQ